MKPVRLAAAAALVSLVSCGGGGSKTAHVTGTVYDGGTPVAGAVVKVGGKQVVTGADGTFSADVALPYDLTAAVAAQRVALVAYGLRATKLYLDLPGASGLPAHTADLSGTVTGADAAGTVTRITASAAGLRRSAPVSPADSTFQLTLYWGGAATQQVSLRALQHVPGANGWPTSYTGFATGTATVTGGAPTVAPAMALAGPVPATTVSGTVALDASWPGATISGTAKISGGLASAFTGAAVTGTSFSALLPDLGGELQLGVLAGDPAAGGPFGQALAPVAPGEAGVALTVPAAPSLASPADGATAGAGTAFSWSASGGSLRELWVNCSGATATWSVIVYGASNSVALPDLSAFGMPLASGMDCGWWAVASSWTADELLDAVYVIPGGWSTSSAARSFTSR